MMEYGTGKDLPPITLSNTTVSYLVTLIPLLVSMTTRGEIPSYEDEADKPAWWPEDVQWRNPKWYMQDNLKKADGLKVLRKLVYSCYSYHGVEDLLIRLDESAVSDSELEPMDTGDIIQLTDDYEDGVEDSSAESEGPVFVCCFCLDQFSSHDEVSTHQNTCIKRFDDNASNKILQFDSKSAVESNAVDTRSQLHSPTFTGSQSAPSHLPPQPLISSATSSSLSSSSSSSSSISKLDDAFLTQSLSTSSSPSVCVQTPAAQAPSQQSSGVLRKTTAVAYPFVPTLKTRSQKKMDQIMEKHNLRRLMRQECHAMKDVPEKGAWWVKRPKPQSGVGYRHPDTYLTQQAFISVIGLAKLADVQAMNRTCANVEKEVDLDCEMITVDVAAHSKSIDKHTSVSPRTARSLMSQLSRDSEFSSRRRMSFSFVEDEWADKEALEEGRDPLQQSLLTLDVSSPLGFRVRKYIKGEGCLNIIKDSESYCRTELDDDGYSKLRFRGNDYRVTFRRKRRATTYVHKYKFNKGDRIEFKHYLKTGLNAHSRQLQQCLPMCRVVLTRMTDAEIKSWTEEKKITIAEKIIYDDDICITQIEIPESKFAQAKTNDNMMRNRLASNQQGDKSRHRMGPLSSQNLERSNSSTPNRKSFAPHAVPSPPHVPNIFRNRPSHTPSPPRPCAGPQHLSHSQHVPPRPSVGKARSLSGWHEPSKLSYTPLSKVSAASQNQTSQGKQMQHLSRHMCLTPSAYTTGHAQRSPERTEIKVVDKQNLGQINRRKQLMTHVRKDESDRVGHNTVTTNSFIPIDQFNNPFSRQSTVSNLSAGNVRSSSASRNSFTSNNLTVSSSSAGKLSNFDHFSIKNNKLLPTTSSGNRSGIHPPSPHMAARPSSSTGQPGDKIPSKPTPHNSYCVHHKPQTPSSALAQPPHQHHHHHHHHLSALASDPGQPCSVIHHRPSPYQTHSHSNSKPTGPTHSQVNKFASGKGTRAEHERKSGHLQSRPPPSQPHPRNTESNLSRQNVPPRSRTQPAIPSPEDDDVLEVICIDDD